MNPDRQQKINEINKLGPCWRAIWLALLDTNHCSVFAEDNCYIAEFKQQLPSAFEDFWQEEIEGATARGWNWHGDTGVYVTKITGPVTIQQVLKYRSKCFLSFDHYYLRLQCVLIR